MQFRELCGLLTNKLVLLLLLLQFGLTLSVVECRLQHAALEPQAATVGLAVAQPAHEGRILDLSTRTAPEWSQRHNEKRRQPPRVHIVYARTARQQQQQQQDAQQLVAQLQASTSTTTTTSVDTKPSRVVGDERSRGAPPRQEAPAARQAKCTITGRSSGSKGLRDILTSAKNLLTGGFSSIEQRAGNFLWFGSNVLATLIPLASLLGLGTGASHQSAAATPPPLIQTNTSIQQQQQQHTTNRRLGSLLSGPGSLIVQLASGAGGLHSRVEHVMGWLERSVEHLPSFPRLHPQECVKRCICEAHADPSRYGALGLTLRLLFPASSQHLEEIGTGPDGTLEYKVLNKYRHAAGYGMARRRALTDSVTLATASGDSNNDNSTATNASGSWTSGPSEQSAAAAASAACKEKYEDCLVSLLDVAQNLLDLFLGKS